jgi:hypothetical protein
MAFRLSAPASVAIIVAAICVVVLSAAVRLYELQRPSVFVFDEVYYANDAHAILHGDLGPNPLYPWEPGAGVSWPHPEYGKLAIALGEALFGDVAFGSVLPRTCSASLHRRRDRACDEHGVRAGEDDSGGVKIGLRPAGPYTPPARGPAKAPGGEGNLTSHIQVSAGRTALRSRTGASPRNPCARSIR